MAESGVEVAKKFVVTASDTELSMLLEKLKGKELFANTSATIVTILLVR